MLTTVALCVPVTSPASEPLKFVAVPAVVALPAVVAVAALVATMVPVPVALNDAPLPTTMAAVVLVPLVIELNVELVGVAFTQLVPLYCNVWPFAGEVTVRVLPWIAESVVPTVPTVEVTSPVRAGILAAATVPLDKLLALRLVRLAPLMAGNVPVRLAAGRLVVCT